MTLKEIALKKNLLDNENLHIFITDLGLGNLPIEFILGAVLHVTEGMANMGGKYPRGGPPVGAPPGIFYRE